jgi:hypothetical protein
MGRSCGRVVRVDASSGSLGHGKGQEVASIAPTLAGKKSIALARTYSRVQPAEGMSVVRQARNVERARAPAIASSRASNDVQMATCLNDVPAIPTPTRPGAFCSIDSLQSERSVGNYSRAKTFTTSTACVMTIGPRTFV